MRLGPSQLAWPWCTGHIHTRQSLWGIERSSAELYHKPRTVEDTLDIQCHNAIPSRLWKAAECPERSVPMKRRRDAYSVMGAPQDMPELFTRICIFEVLALISSTNLSQPALVFKFSVKWGPRGLRRRTYTEICHNIFARAGAYFVKVVRDLHNSGDFKFTCERDRIAHTSFSCLSFLDAMKTLAPFCT